MFGAVFGVQYGGTVNTIGSTTTGDLSWQPPPIPGYNYSVQYATPTSYTRLYASPLQMALKQLAEVSWEEDTPASAGSWEE